jgi:hypothetical protein
MSDAMKEDTTTTQIPKHYSHLLTGKEQTGEAIHVGPNTVAIRKLY